MASRVTGAAKGVAVAGAANGVAVTGAAAGDVALLGCGAGPGRERRRRRGGDGDGRLRRPPRGSCEVMTFALPGGAATGVPSVVGTSASWRFGHLALAPPRACGPPSLARFLD